jgi:hypothetical protein
MRTSENLPSTHSGEGSRKKGRSPTLRILWWQPCISAFPFLTDPAYGAASSCLRVAPLAALMAFTVSVRRPISARFAVLALLHCW